MASVDEILADPLGALDLPDGSIPVSVVLLVEYVNPSSEFHSNAKRLATVTDEELSPWVSIGMMRFAQQLEYDAVKQIGDDPDGEPGE